MASKYDLEERTTKFGRNVVSLTKSFKRDPINDRLIGQVVGAAGSVGANYREANDALGKKDFVQRMKIARREVKESQHWLELLIENNEMHKDQLTVLMKEAGELRSILSSIISKF